MVITMIDNTLDGRKPNAENKEKGSEALKVGSAEDDREENIEESLEVSYVDTLHLQLISRLKSYINEAGMLGGSESNCGFLATTGTDLQPNVRIVTICKVSTDGLCFLANSHSGKIQQLIENPQAGLCFYWPQISIQATVEGKFVPLSREFSERLWNSRDHYANVAAWCNERSLPKRQHVHGRMPMPDSWSGYCIEPSRVDFWSTCWKKNRPHECYLKHDSGWQRLTR